MPQWPCWEPLFGSTSFPGAIFFGLLEVPQAVYELREGGLGERGLLEEKGLGERGLGERGLEEKGLEEGPHVVAGPIEMGLRADSKITSAFWRAAATASGVRLHRRINNMPASPSCAALSSPRQNTQFIYEPTLTAEIEPTVMGEGT